MKKTLLIFLGFSLLSSCSEKENKIDTEKIDTKKTYLKIDDLDYRGQLPYIEKDDTLDVNKVNIKFKVKEIVKNENADWKVLDNFFNQNLTSFESQYLSYLILSKKDLIKEYKSNQTDELRVKLIFHLDNLIKNENVGYCLLYNSLISLKNSNPDYVKQKAIIISNYSKKDKYHSEILNDENYENDPIMSKYFKKIKENYSFLKRIETLK
jgi:hypothetical protein